MSHETHQPRPAPRPWTAWIAVASLVVAAGLTGWSLRTPRAGDAPSDAQAHSAAQATAATQAPSDEQPASTALAPSQRRATAVVDTSIAAGTDADADDAARQYLVEVMILEIDHGRTAELGFAFESGRSLATGQSAVADAAGEPAPGRRRGLVVLDDDRAFVSLVETLCAEGCATLLARPTLAVTDGRPATFQVGSTTAAVPLPDVTPLASPDATIEADSVPPTALPAAANAPPPRLLTEETLEQGFRITLLATQLDGNRVRLNLRPRVRRILPRSESDVAAGVPASARTFEIDTALELRCGQSAALCGASIDTADGRREVLLLARIDELTAR